MRRLLVALSVAAAAAAAVALWQLAAPRPSAPVPLEKNAAVVSAPAAPPMAQARAQIRDAIARDVPKVKTVGDLEGYLSELETTARRNHRVTSLEVEPGMEAIRARQEELGLDAMVKRQLEFSHRMSQLAAEFQGSVETHIDLDDLARRIERARGDERQQLIRSYIDDMATLSPDEHVLAGARLNQLAAN